jgi:SAM-dependent methyltransferase
LVGSKGSVTGVDMTDEQLAVARAHVDSYCTETLGYDTSNMQFVTGYIEDLAAAGVSDGSVDLVISNCVVNLSPDKPAVLRGVYDALRDGGELHFADVYCDRRLPQHVQDHDTLWGECVSGALYVEDFKRICNQVGFTDPRVLEASQISITDPELAEIVGEAQFYSITYRCFKLPGLLETLCEDYGQVAYYHGTIPGHTHSYSLDDHHRFETGRPMLVCGNPASMVGDSWLAPHFKIVGDRSVHFGLFDCAPAPGAGLGAPVVVDAPAAGGACC